VPEAGKFVYLGFDLLNVGHDYQMIYDSHIKDKSSVLDNN